MKVCYMLCIPGINIIPTESVHTYDITHDTIRINPRIEMNEHTRHFFLRVMGNRTGEDKQSQDPITEIRAYFEEEVRKIWSECIENMVSKRFETEDIPILSDMLTRMVDRRCPACVVGSVFSYNDPKNIIVPHVAVCVHTHWGFVHGLWDYKMKKYVPARTPSEQSQVTKKCNEATRPHWQQKIATMIEQGRVANTYCDVVIEYTYNGDFRLANPLYIRTNPEVLMLFVPKLHIGTSNVKVSVGAVGTHQWEFSQYRGTFNHENSIVPIRCTGLERKSDEFRTTTRQGIVRRLSCDELNEELTKFFAGTSDNPILRHVYVSRIDEDVYHLYCDRTHMLAGTLEK